MLLWGALVSCEHRNKKDVPYYDLVLHKDNHIPNKEANDYFEKGLQCIERRDYANAKNAFLHADHICPNMPVILNAIGNSTAYTEVPENAIPYYEKALEVDSTFIKTYVNFGCCLNNMRDYERAKHIFNLGLTRPSAYKTDRRALFLDLANSYFLEKNYEKALILLDSARAGGYHDQINNLAEIAARNIRTKYAHDRLISANPHPRQ